MTNGGPGATFNDEQQAMKLIGELVCLTLVATSCAGCTNRLFGIYTGVADLSTLEATEKVATITAGTWRFDCAIADPTPVKNRMADPKPAKKLIVDPGPIEMRVVCESPISSWSTDQRFAFTAIAGHNYKVNYGLTMCMRLRDMNLDTIVADFCEHE